MKAITDSFLGTGPDISWHEGATQGNERFSIIIPTWNNLAYVRLCVESIRKNSTYPHQIILHVNEGTDGTVEWAEKEGLSYSRSMGNAGVCWGCNAARALVRTEYICYMNDDMYVCPGWDRALKEEIAGLGTKYFFVSATMIEPYPTRSKPVIGGRNFGTTVEEFEEERLLREYMNFEKEDWSGATRPPNVMHRDVWDLIGGYSVEYTPGLYSDPDLSAKLWLAGVREFKGVGRSRVYHFVSKSLGRLTPNKGRQQFIGKWGMKPSTFYRRFIRKGEKYEGACVMPERPRGLWARLFGW